VGLGVGLNDERRSQRYRDSIHGIPSSVASRHTDFVVPGVWQIQGVTLKINEVALYRSKTLTQMFEIRKISFRNL